MRALPSRSSWPVKKKIIISTQRSHTTPQRQGYNGQGEHTKASPLAEHLAIGDLDQGDLVLLAQGDDELLVGLLLAALVEHAHVGLAAVEGLGRLAQATRQAVVDQSDPEHTLERVQDRHLAAGAGGRGDFDLIGGGDGGVGSGLFSVRLFSKSIDHVSLFRPFFVLI